MTIIPMLLAMTIALGGVTWVIFFMGEMGGEVRGPQTPPTPGDAEKVTPLAAKVTAIEGSVVAAQSSDAEKSLAA